MFQIEGAWSGDCREHGAFWETRVLDVFVWQRRGRPEMRGRLAGTRVMSKSLEYRAEHLELCLEVNVIINV